MTWRRSGTAGWAGSSRRPTLPRRWARSCGRSPFGHVRQLDAIASRFLIALAGLTRVLGDPIRPDAANDGGYASLDVDDTIVEVHGHAKQGAGFGYSGVRGLNALLATLTTAATTPVIVAQRLRKGACGSPRGAKRLVGDAVKTARRLLGKDRLILVRMDSALYGRGPVHAALAGGAAVSVTVRMDEPVKKAIAAIPDDAWTTIEYTDAEGGRQRILRSRPRTGGESLDASAIQSNYRKRAQQAVRGSCS